MPAKYARQIEYFGALADREAAMERDGLPVCKWAADWDETPLPDDDADLLASFDALEAHERTCPDCLARERYAARHLPPIPAPPWRSRWISFFGGLSERTVYIILFAFAAVVTVLTEGLGSPSGWSATFPAVKRMLGLLAAAAVVGGLGCLVVYYARSLFGRGK